MPKVTAKKASFIEEQMQNLRDGEKPSIKIVKEADLPTPEEQAEATADVQTHVITLLDGAKIELPADLTVADVTKKRIDGLLYSLTQLLLAETRKFKDVRGDAQMVLAAVINSSDTIGELTFKIVSKLTGVAVERFEDNIGAGELVDTVLKVLTLLAPLMADAAKSKRT